MCFIDLALLVPLGSKSRSRNTSEFKIQRISGWGFLVERKEISFQLSFRDVETQLVIVMDPR